MNARRLILAASLILVPAPMPAAAAGQEAAAGERLFRTRCGSCHSLEAGQNRIGPTLIGLLGRKAGSVEGARYSPGMRALNITWDAEQLNSFLANPRAMVTGTSMTVAVSGEAERASIVAYLQGATRKDASQSN